MDLTVTNYHDLMKLMCADFQLRVIKSAFKAAWVVLRGAPPRPPPPPAPPRSSGGKQLTRLTLPGAYHHTGAADEVVVFEPSSLACMGEARFASSRLLPGVS